MRWDTYYSGWNMSWNMPFWGVALFPLVGLAVLLLVVWSLYWKGRSLWVAARKGDKLWFVILLLVNTLGILEIFYIYRFSKKSLPKSEPVETKEN